MAKMVQAQIPIGIELYSFRNQFKTDVAGTLEKIGKMGFREIEGGNTYGLSIDSFKTLLKKNNLTTVSIGVDYKELETDPQAVADKAKALGATYVVCFWIPHTGTEFTFENAKKAVDVFNAAGKLLKENGISFCYHPHGYEFRPYAQSTLFDYMMKNMKPRYANFQMDVFWIKHPGQDPVALLKKYKKRFLLMHLKDRKPGTPGNQNGQADVESNVILGTGDVNIAAIIKQAKKSRIKHYFIEDESSRSMEQVPRSLAYMNFLTTKTKKRGSKN
ncbi:MAG: sugar phosphate isomerase/epimerase [Chitinophagaceae bacterium]|nr:sugar phosphate isomerase/epimerase [Chitinophagaceae bacterium]